MIEVNNLTGFRANKDFLKKIAQKVLEGESSFAKASEDKGKKELELSIALVGSERIRKLNKKYRKKDRPTDVLSFTYNDKSGEIVICPQEVKKNTKKFGMNFKKELTRVLIHGILHLLGYDHEKSEQDYKKMERKENYYFNLLNKKND